MSSVAQGASARRRRRELPREVWPLIGANAIIALGYGVVAPVLPQLARHFGVSISAATFLITAFAVMRLCAAPPTGLLVQRLGERWIYVSGVLIVALSTAACAFAHTYWQLLLFRALGGIGSTMFFVSALGLMIRISPPDARGRVAGMFSSGFLVGSVVGPVLGSLTAGLGLSAPFLIYGALLLVAAVIVLVSLRHSAAGRAGRQGRVDGHRAGCAAAPGLSGGAAVELRHRLVVVRAAFRPGAAVRRRDSRPQPRDGGAGTGRVRRGQRRGGDPQRPAVGPDRA